MRKKALYFATAVVLVFATLAVASPSWFRTGLTRIARNAVSPGWVVFTGSDGVTYVIGTDGIPVHRWVSPVPSSTLRGSEPIIDKPGHVLSVFTNPVVPDCEVDCGQVVEMDWDGNVVWEYLDPNRFFHHDLQRLDNGNTMLMCSKTLDRPEIAPVPIIDDCLVEVTPDGDVVWEWQTADHYDELDLTDEERQMISDSAELLLGDWSHGNAIDSISVDTPHTDPRFRPGNVIVSYRHINLVLIVDRDTDEVVWQSRASIGQHFSHMIENGFTGAGNIMVFDNGFGGMYPSIARNNSRVIEIDPLTDEIVRTYTADLSGIPPWTFYSAFVGSAQRLPNGNMMVSEGMYGRVFEVDPSGRLVWEFVNPTFNTFFGFASNVVPRYYKVPVSWAGPLGERVSWPVGAASGPEVADESLRDPARWF